MSEENQEQDDKIILTQEEYQQKMDGATANAMRRTRTKLKGALDEYAPEGFDWETAGTKDIVAVVERMKSSFNDKITEFSNKLNESPQEEPVDKEKMEAQIKAQYEAMMKREKSEFLAQATKSNALSQVMAEARSLGLVDSFKKQSIFEAMFREYFDIEQGENGEVLFKDHKTDNWLYNENGSAMSAADIAQQLKKHYSKAFTTAPAGLGISKPAGGFGKGFDPLKMSSKDLIEAGMEERELN